MKNRRSYFLENESTGELGDQDKSLSLDQKSKKLLDYFGLPYCDARELKQYGMNSDDDDDERLNLGQRINVEGSYANVEFANSNTNQNVSRSQMNYLKKKKENPDDSEPLPKNIN